MTSESLRQMEAAAPWRVPSPAMNVRARVAVVVLAAWTAFVWGTRINNALADTELSAGGKAFSIALSASLLGLAVASVWSVWTARAVRVIQVFTAWTVVVWAVRIPMILVADHAVGFKVVHAMLGLVSITLAAVAYRAAVSPAREPAGSLY